MGGEHIPRCVLRGRNNGEGRAERDAKADVCSDGAAAEGDASKGRG